MTNVTEINKELLKQQLDNINFMFEFDSMNDEEIIIASELVQYLDSTSSIAQQLAVFKAIKYDREELEYMLEVFRNPKLTIAKKNTCARACIESMKKYDF